MEIMLKAIMDKIRDAVVTPDDREVESLKELYNLEECFKKGHPYWCLGAICGSDITKRKIDEYARDNGYEKVDKAIEEIAESGRLAKLKNTGFLEMAITRVMPMVVSTSSAMCIPAEYYFQNQEVWPSLVALGVGIGMLALGKAYNDHKEKQFYGEKLK